VSLLIVFADRVSHTLQVNIMIKSCLFEIAESVALVVGLDPATPPPLDTPLWSSNMSLPDPSFDEVQYPSQEDSE
jgi:hypothetical protein